MTLIADSSIDSAPLSGIRVVDFGQFIAGPGAAQILADLGADVIKIEGPDGDRAREIGSYGRAIMRAYNRRKRSVVLDLKADAGVATATALITRADVVIHNSRPGVMERLGLGVAEVRAINNSVVYASVSGFGVDGPSGERPGLDIAAQAESGAMSVTGEPGGPPLRVGFPVMDHAASYVLAQGILSALFRRERTGCGDQVTVSLLDIALDLQSVCWGEYGVTGDVPTRRGNGQPGAAPAADVFRTADGSVVVSAYTDEHFRRLCGLAGVDRLPDDPDFADNEHRVANRARLLDLLAPYFVARDTRTVLAELSAAGIVAGHVRTYPEVLAAADVEAGRLFVPGHESGEDYRIPGLPFTTTAVPRGGDGGAVPALGEHTAEVLAELSVAGERTGVRSDAPAVR